MRRANLPVIVINGARPGPVLALISGAHGTEYASILAMHKLAQSVDPGSLSGTLVVLPLLNQASFAQMVPHLNPVDGKSLNRLYPGKADGTQSERISWAVTRQVLDKSDYVMDFHGGDLDENLRRYAYWADTGQDRMDSVSRGMVLAFGLDHIIIQRNRTPAANGAVTVSRQAQNMGKPTIVVEAGHAGTTAAEDVDVLVQGIAQRDASSTHAARHGAAGRAPDLARQRRGSRRRPRRLLSSAGDAGSLRSKGHENRLRHRRSSAKRSRISRPRCPAS